MVFSSHIFIFYFLPLVIGIYYLLLGLGTSITLRHLFLTCAGMVFYGAYVGEEQAEFWKGSLFYGPDNHILHAMHEVSFLVKASPFIAMLVGLAIAYWFYILSPALPRKLAGRQTRSIAAPSCARRRKLSWSTAASAKGRPRSSS